MYYLYAVFAGILGVVALFTREIVTFIMLGFVLLALNNIHKTLQEISKKMDRRD